MPDQETIATDAIRAWKSVLAAVNCGDNSITRHSFAVPALEFLSAILVSHGYVAIEDHAAVIPAHSRFNGETGEVDGKILAGQKFWTKDAGWEVATEDIPAL